MLKRTDGNCPVQRNAAILGIIEVFTKQLCPFCGSRLQVNVRIVHGRNQLDIAFCTGNGNIQPSFTADTVQRTEIMQQTALCINAIGNTENDRISFVTLHSFKVLYKERLVPIVLEEIFFFWRALPPLRKQLINQVLLCYAERNHTKTAVRVFLNILINQVNNELRFLTVGMNFAVKYAIHVIIVYTNTRSVDLRRWERHKIAVIEILVGESNKLFVTTAIMPAQPKLLHGCRTQIQNGFKICYISGFLIAVLRFNGCIEEIAGRHLLRVTHNNQLLCPIDCADCILRENL